VSVAVIIPYGGVYDEWRHRNLQFVVDFYRDTLPDVPRYIATMEGMPFNKAAAVTNAVFDQARYADTIILADADSLVYPSSLIRSLGRVIDGEPYVRPFDVYRRLDNIQTAHMATWRQALYASIHEWEMDGSDSHGCVVMQRRVFEQAGGYDPAFEGWGYEDLAFDVVVDALGHTMGREPGPLYHLYHPPAEESEANRARYHLYESRRGDLPGLLQLREDPC
jgi:hypothetical protein